MGVTVQAFLPMRVHQSPDLSGEAQSTQEQNKTLVLERSTFFLINATMPRAEQLWSPQYIQHSAHIAPGREGALQPY
jgi:hypothetical protein